jgi:uncharacterized protein YeaO (DUF488 family)
MDKEQIQLKRAYVQYDKKDGYRILVDRMWPRGISKKDLHCDLWVRDIAPSNELRKKFHKDQHFKSFTDTYIQELERNDIARKFIKFCDTELQKNKITLLYAAKDETYNNAVILRQWLIYQLSHLCSSCNMGKNN